MVIPIPRLMMEDGMSPEGFDERFEQLILDLDGTKVYIRKENITQGQEQIPIQFYKARRLGGTVEK
jgi:hypothetical protein